jgi:DNA repair protein RadC
LITLEDCIGLCGLSEAEVDAIAEHEHLPEIAAAALAEYLLSQAQGTDKVRDMIVDDIRQAERAGAGKAHVVTLLHVLHHFLRTHPEAMPAQHPWSKRF